MKKTLDWNRYLDTAAEVVSEGIVMLKNDNNALPLEKNEEIALFGRIQFNYYKSGTGSGGMVNVSKITGIPEGLSDCGIKINKELSDAYEKWLLENPFDIGEGWGGEPWSQKEMPLSDELVRSVSEKCGKAVVIIGRTAGEEQENRVEEGSFLLTEAEKDMLTKVRGAFEKMIVLLNVGNLIDLEFIEELRPDSLLYVWQGGMTGGTGTAAVLTGKVSPSGKLPDTVAYSISDYPSDPYFGNTESNSYAEDIYVGYRYFETFAKDRVRYPFGFGLSYTTFDINVVSCEASENAVALKISVKNTGNSAGKEVVQVYLEAPQGKLGKPARVLCGFEKTKTLAPDEEQVLEIKTDLRDFASYDDSGVTGNRFCRILEAGEYNFYAGSDVRSAKKVLSKELNEDIVVERLTQAMAPVREFQRIRPESDGEGYKAVFEAVPLNEVDEDKRRLDNLPAEIPQTGDRGIKLCDVVSGKNTMTEFIAQLTDYDLSCIIRGEGMGSPRVTAGTASAFGGVSDSLTALGIPAGCCSDGPSGMRMDCGTKAFSIPIGTLIASTFNKELVTELFTLLGLEMTANNVDCLLGPGMNIHRHPLNGRNFEYFSEDPYLTGEIAAAELDGLHSVGVTGTIKHFCGNNQETNRHFLESVVSERALREIYLRGFEIAVKKGKAQTVMTTYGIVNGLWTSASYDLNTVILRQEWGFEGFVMTDWWANINQRGQWADKTNFAAMARAQNDVYMVCADGGKHNDNTLEALEKGTLTRAELQRNAMNVLGFIIGTNAMKRLMGEDTAAEVIDRPEDKAGTGAVAKLYEIDGELTLSAETVEDFAEICTDKGAEYSFALDVKRLGHYKITITASSTQSELAQIPLTLFTMGTAAANFTWNGTGGKPVAITKEINMFSAFTSIRLYFAQSGLTLHSIKVEYTGAFEEDKFSFTSNS
ncbi:MAG: glycoside hydrolase family 3 protein [Ruminiclostridium sp.]|nr:glycoside hydrolase family 3 protein [Ruminiclostridium sp.]